jgi:hypothetical protein
MNVNMLIGIHATENVTFLVFWPTYVHFLVFWPMSIHMYIGACMLVNQQWCNSLRRNAVWSNWGFKIEILLIIEHRVWNDRKEMTNWNFFHSLFGRNSATRGRGKNTKWQIVLMNWSVTKNVKKKQNKKRIKTKTGKRLKWKWNVSKSGIGDQ